MIIEDKTTPSASRRGSFTVILLVAYLVFYPCFRYRYDIFHTFLGGSSRDLFLCAFFSLLYKNEQEFWYNLPM